MQVQKEEAQKERYAMVKYIIQPTGVLDQKILDVMLACPREKFVPESYLPLAYADTAIPIGNSQIMLTPSLVGKILDSLGLTGNEHVLEGGTGSGYLTWLLAQLSRSVTSVEIVKPLAILANNKLNSSFLANTEVLCGNIFTILKSRQAFDVVVLTGSVPYLPEAILNQVKIGGRIFAIVGKLPIMHACIFTRIKEVEWNKKILFETVVPALKELHNAPKFEF